MAGIIDPSHNERRKGGLLGREDRRRNLLADSKPPGGKADKLDDLDCHRARSIQQEHRETRQELSAAGEQPQVVPRIQVLLDRQEKNVRRAGALLKLAAVRIPFPADIAEKGTIGGAKRDQVTTATMVRAENKCPGAQFGEGTVDIACMKCGAIPPDRDDFLITEVRQRLDRVLETRREIPTRLAMHQRRGRCGAVGRSKKVDVNAQRKIAPQRAEPKEWASRVRKSAPGKVDMDFVGKNEKSAPGHASGYETAREAGKSFRAPVGGLLAVTALSDQPLGGGSTGVGNSYHTSTS